MLAKYKSWEKRKSFNQSSRKWEFSDYLGKKQLSFGKNKRLADDNIYYHENIAGD